MSQDDTNKTESRDSVFIFWVLYCYIAIVIDDAICLLGIPIPSSALNRTKNASAVSLFPSHQHSQQRCSSASALKALECYYGVTAPRALCCA
eukprot:14089325-Ditylum_brightwellii.AAC.1